jgi:branched-chain amino acid transport system permease protein
VALLYLYTLTPLGRLTYGLRENSHRLRFLGYNVHGLGTAVFAISAMFSGVAGSLQVMSNESANYVVFDPSLSAAVILNSYIGGVNVFLGPAFGAAIMTFFGYAVSDLTQSWLLYQGILFVLVMMFMPAGLAGLPGTIGRLRRRFGLARVLPLLLLSLGAVLVLAAAGTFTIELLQRVFSQDYRAAMQMNPGNPWPPVVMFAREWSPRSPATWAVPVALLAVGLLLVRFARQRRTALEDDEPDGAAPQAALSRKEGVA